MERRECTSGRREFGARAVKVSTATYDHESCDLPSVGNHSSRFVIWGSGRRFSKQTLGVQIRVLIYHCLVVGDVGTPQVEAGASECSNERSRYEIDSFNFDP